MRAFVTERITGMKYALSSPIKRFKLMTFANVHLTKNKKTPSVEKVKSIDSDTELFVTCF